MIDVRNLTVRYGPRESCVRALESINLTVEEGSIFGIVGESGSGKSTLAMTIMRLLPKSGVVEDGQIMFNGRDLLSLPDSEFRGLRGATLSLVFQGAMNTLNPLIRIDEQVAEPLMLHGRAEGDEAIAKAHETLELVGLDSSTWRKYPHELSGGMKQRTVIASAIITQPRVLIADEPSTALDVITQVQIMNLLRSLQGRLRMTVIFISHDLPLVSEISDRIAIMYGGKVCETGLNGQIMEKPLHPYTAGLIDSVPSTSSRKKISAIPGDPVDMKSPPAGCRFRARCTRAVERCGSYAYDVTHAEKEHDVYCTLYGN